MQGIAILSSYLIVLGEIVMRKMDKNVGMLFLILFCLTPIIALCSDVKFLKTFISLSFIHVVPLGYILYKESKFSIKLIYFILILNSIALLLEISTGIKIVIAEGYEWTSLVYRFGLFSSPKIGAFVILLTGLIAYFKGNKLFLYIAFFATFLTGVRASSVGLFLPVLHISFTDFRYFSFKFKISAKNILRFSIILIFCIFALNYLIDYLGENEAFINRFFSSLSKNDQSNQERVDMWNKHLEIFLSYPFVHFLFGKYGYANSIIGNGAENQFLTILSDYGFFIFLIFLISLFYICKYYRYQKKVLIICFVLIFVSMSAKFANSFADGSLYWFLIFLIISQSSKYQACST